MGGAGVPPGADEIVETFPCPNCERRFNSVALAKHVAKQICKQKPRKTFDMAAQRLEDLVQEAREVGIVLLPKKGSAAAIAKEKEREAAAKKAAGGGDGGAIGGSGGKKQSKWRTDHAKFMAAIQAGKQMQQAVANGIPLSSIPQPVTREEDDDRTPCPHWSTHTKQHKHATHPPRRRSRFVLAFGPWVIGAAPGLICVSLVGFVCCSVVQRS